MKEMVLLGAGASVEAGIPAAFDMTRRMVELFGADPSLRGYSRVLRFAVGGLLYQQGIKGYDPFEGVNIEDLFNAIDLLARREEADIAAFVSSWHPLVDELDRTPQRANFRNLRRAIRDSIAKDFAEAFHSLARSSKAKEIDKALEDMAKGRRQPKSLGHIVAELISDTFKKVRAKSPRTDRRFETEFGRAAEPQELPGEGRVFRQTNELMTRKLVDMVWVEDPAKVEYLAPLLRYAQQNTLTITTLNYDNTIEVAAKTASVPLTAGIETWSQTGRFPERFDEVQLFKLHGSVDWALLEGHISEDRPLSHLVVEAVSIDTMRESGFKPAVIFGHRNKLTTQGPFLELLRVFERALSQADRLTIVGYSFRDEHINNFLVQWLNTNPQATLRVVDKQDFRNSEIELARSLGESLKSRFEMVVASASEGIECCFGGHKTRTNDQGLAG